MSNVDDRFMSNANTIEAEMNCAALIFIYLFIIIIIIFWMENIVSCQRIMLTKTLVL